MGKITVEIELEDDETKKLDELIEARFLEREKFLKHLLRDGIKKQIEKREIALGHISRTKAGRVSNLQGKRA